MNDADSILEVLRAKYGDYKGANVEEFFKELIANDVKPSSGGGGGATFPTFTYDNGRWSCDMTYAEAKAVWMENEADFDAPCKAGDGWTSYSLLDGEDFQEAKSEYDYVPDDMTEGLVIMRTPPFLFGSDGNFYFTHYGS